MPAEEDSATETIWHVAYDPSSLLLPQAPFEQVSMDLLGPFPSSSVGKKRIIVAMDHLTNYTEMQTLLQGTASEVMLFTICVIVLTICVIATSRGKAFTVHLVHDILKLIHTSHRVTTAYHPQTNGLTE